MRHHTTLLASLLLLSCGTKVRDPADPVPLPNTDAFAGQGIVDTYPHQGMTYVSMGAGSKDGSPGSTCELVEGCILSVVGAPRPCSSNPVTWRSVGTLTFSSPTLGGGFSGDFPKVVPAGEVVSFHHTGSSDVVPFDLSVTMPSYVGGTVGGCRVDSPGDCRLDVSRPFFLEGPQMDDVQVIVLVGEAATDEGATQATCAYGLGQAKGRLPAGVVARLRRGREYDVWVSAGRSKVVEQRGQLHLAQARVTYRFPAHLP